MSRVSQVLATGPLLALLGTVLSPPGPAQSSGTPPAAQSSTTTPPTSSNKPAPEKRKKVWTEEDLRRIHGGVNVVGEADKPPANRPKGGKTAAGDASKVEESVPDEPPERPQCKSWSWAAAVDAVLAAQGMNLGREYWIQKSYGGEICTTALGDLAALANRVAGDYTLEDASKVQIKAFQALSPSGFDIVRAEEQGIPYIVVWKGHPYVITGYTGVRLVSSDGKTIGYNLKTLTMADPYEERRVTFDQTRDTPQDIQGAVQFVVMRP